MPPPDAALNVNLNGSSAARGVGIIMVSSVMFGSMAVFVRLASSEMASAQIAFFRFAGALLVLLAFSRGRNLRPRPGNLRHVLLRSALGAAAILFYFKGIEGAGAGFATLLQGTYPVYTAIIAALLLDEPFHPRLGMALILNLTGSFIAVGSAADLGAATLNGALCALAASVLAGGAVAAARHLRMTESAMLITTYFMAVGALVTAPSLRSGLPPFTPLLVGALLGTIMTSVVGQFLLHQGLGWTGASQGSLACATGVISATVLEALFLGTSITARTLAGAALLISAVALSIRGRTEPATSGS